MIQWMVTLSRRTWALLRLRRGEVMLGASPRKSKVSQWNWPLTCCWNPKELCSEPPSQVSTIHTADGCLVNELRALWEGCFEQLFIADPLRGQLPDWKQWMTIHPTDKSPASLDEVWKDVAKSRDAKAAVFCDKDCKAAQSWIRLTSVGGKQSLLPFGNTVLLFLRSGRVGLPPLFFFMFGAVASKHHFGGA